MLPERRFVSLYLSRVPALWRRLSSFQCLNPQMLFAFQVQSNLHLLPTNIIIPLEISCLSIRGLAHSHFSFHYLHTAPTHLYILTQTKLLGVVGAGTPLGDQLLLHTAAITLIWMQILLFQIACVHITKCAILPDESKSCALAWWLAWWQAYQNVEAQNLLYRMMEIKQIVHWSLVTRQCNVCYPIHLQWNDLILSIQV